MGLIRIRASRRARAHVRRTVQKTRNLRKAKKGTPVQRLEKLFRKAHAADSAASRKWIKNNPGLYGKPGLIDSRTDFSRRQRQLSRRVEVLRDDLNNARVGRKRQSWQGSGFFPRGRY